MVAEVIIKELGVQEYTDPSGETIHYYAIQFTTCVGDQEYTLVTSLDPDTTPEDPEYTAAMVRGRAALLAKVQAATQ